MEERAGYCLENIGHWNNWGREGVESSIAMCPLEYRPISQTHLLLSESLFSLLAGIERGLDALRGSQL